MDKDYVSRGEERMDLYRRMAAIRSQSDADDLLDEIVDRFGDDPVAMLDAGVAYATEQIVDLFANDVNNVHVYTMNKPEVAVRIMRNLHGVVGPR